MKIIPLIIVLFVLKPLPSTASDPYALLSMHFTQIGGIENLKALESYYSEGAIRYDKMEGSYREWRRKPLHSRLEVRFPVFSSVEGDSGTVAWQHDVNGRVLIYKDPATLHRRTLSRLLENYEHLDPDSSIFNLRYNGFTLINGESCHDLQLDNTINQDTTNFYLSGSTLLMIASKHTTADFEVITHYDDFRMVEGLLIPFHSLSKYSPTGREEERHIHQILVNSPIPEELFAVPESVVDYRFPDGHTSVSAHFSYLDNLIYLPVTINDQTRLWLLDSGASMSVIDHSFALELGLQPEGSILGHGFGDSFDLGFVRLPGYSMMDIHFSAQKVYVAQDIARQSYEPVIHGILGYDFLSRFVVEIDYDRKTITFHKPKSFQYNGSGIILDAPLKYRTFTVPVTVDGMVPGLWSLDLGAHQSSLHYPFAVNNNLLNRVGMETVSRGIAGFVFGRLSEFGCLNIGGLQLSHQLLTIPHDSGLGASALGEVDGNLGNSTLQNFRIILDYPKQQLILEPGKRFNQQSPRDGSGMLIGRSRQGTPMVSFMDQRGPAYHSGIRTGDILLAINGIQLTTESSVLSVRELLKGKEGSRIQVRILRDHAKLDFEFKLVDLHAIERKACISP